MATRRVVSDSSESRPASTIAPDVPLVGREQDLARVGSLLHGGHVVVLYGPVGVGKSALLDALARRARQRNIPCGMTARAAALSDLTGALARAYPRLPAEGTQRQLRGRLRMAVEARPGVLLLDNLGQMGRAFKGAIRSLRGTGLGVVLAADVDKTRDHERSRVLGLSHCEIELRPLHGSSMRLLLQAQLERQHIAGVMTPAHLRALVVAAEGLPGRAMDFVDALTHPTAWRAGAPRVDWLRTGAIIRAAERYRQGLEGIRMRTTVHLLAGE